MGAENHNLDLDALVRESASAKKEKKSSFLISSAAVVQSAETDGSENKDANSLENTGESLVSVPTGLPATEVVEDEEEKNLKPESENGSALCFDNNTPTVDEVKEQPLEKLGEEMMEPEVVKCSSVSESDPLVPPAVPADYKVIDFDSYRDVFLRDCTDVASDTRVCLSAKVLERVRLIQFVYGGTSVYSFINSVLSDHLWRYSEIVDSAAFHRFTRIQDKDNTCPSQHKE